MITPTCAPSLFTCSRTSRGTRSLVLLGLGSMGLALPVSGMAEGFIDDTKATLNLLNAYINRNYTNPDYPQSKAEEWTQNFILDVKSGFTQGTVGFGVDVLGLYSQKLDGGKGTAGTQLLPTHSDGEPADNFGRLGVAAKAKISNTELKFGNLFPTAPVFATSTARLLPASAEGFQLLSNEIENLSLDAGHFTSIRDASMSSNHDGEIFTSYAGVTANSADYVGGSYSFSDDFSVTLYGSELKDVWRQYYGNANYNIPLSEEQNLNFFLIRCYKISQ